MGAVVLRPGFVVEGSFLAEREGRLAGFLIGFMSQSRPDES